MPLKDALFALTRHAAAAMTFVLVAALALEWFLPGSALPLLNAVSPLPVVGVLTLIAFGAVKRPIGWKSYIQTFVGVCAIAALLAILALSVPNYGWHGACLLASGLVAGALWAVAYSTKTT